MSLVPLVGVIEGKRLATRSACTSVPATNLLVQLAVFNRAKEISSFSDNPAYGENWMLRAFIIFDR